ncbi:hypothetical protein SAMN05216486_10282 [bacterium JGI 053]|nr:hypothetical protein SAMN05216486_10282 [bacterium JGI 053]
MNLNPEDLQVTSFTTAAPQERISTIGGGGFSWPDVCTCIGICQPTEDIYCSGGCPPDTTMPMTDQVQ